MIGDISTPVARYPFTVLLLMAAMLAFGVIANPSLPIAPSPNLEFPTIRVFARLAGASAETMATSVALPMERAFARIEGVRTTTASSKFGSTTVTVEFDLDRPIDAAANAVQAAMNAVSRELPPRIADLELSFVREPSLCRGCLRQRKSRHGNPITRK